MFSLLSDSQAEETVNSLQTSRIGTLLELTHPYNTNIYYTRICKQDAFHIMRVLELSKEMDEIKVILGVFFYFIRVVSNTFMYIFF